MAESTGTKRGPYAKSAQRRRAIVEAAHAVFAERGYTAGSFQVIADRVGMSQTGLLHYFPTKSDLLVAVLALRDEIVDDLHADAARIDERILARAGANEAIPGVVQLYTVLSGEATTAGHPGRDYFVRRFAGLREGYAADLRVLREQGRLREGVDPEVAAASIIALWDGLQLQWLLDPTAVGVERALAAYLDLILPGGAGES